MFIVTKKIDSENITKLCRTCLREDNDKMVCLFVGPAGSSLAAKLRSLSCLEVWTYVDHPLYIKLAMNSFSGVFQLYAS